MSIKEGHPLVEVTSIQGKNRKSRVRQFEDPNDEAFQ